MPNWTREYHDGLKEEFDRLTAGLRDRIEQIATARTTPALDSIAIGSGREFTAAVLFFDIEGSTARTPTGESYYLHQTLVTLNCVIPMISRVITDHGGYIEKNTGDGLMAIFGPGDSSIDDALSAAMTCFFLLRAFVNPYLGQQGIEAVNARIGIDYGEILVGRIGLPTGSASNQRNFLTAIGPAANIACRLQELAGTNGICIGERVRLGASSVHQFYCQVHPPPEGWPWIYGGEGRPYWIWNYTQQRVAPAPRWEDLIADLINAGGWRSTS